MFFFPGGAIINGLIGMQQFDREEVVAGVGGHKWRECQGDDRERT